MREVRTEAVVGQKNTQKHKLTSSTLLSYLENNYTPTQSVLLGAKL